MLFSDRSIKEAIREGNILVSPLAEGAVQPASVDLHMGNCALKVNVNCELYLDPFKDHDYKMEISVISNDGIFVHPGSFTLVATKEWIELGSNIAGRLEGVSSLARMGLIVHATGGWVDPGWKGCLTLELVNVGPLPVLIRPGMKIAQIAFISLTTPAERPYGHPDLKSKYQGAITPMQSLSHLDYVDGKPKDLK